MTPDHTPRAVPEVLTAEEEATLRNPNLVGPGPCDYLIARLLATLDAARGSSEGPGLREALGEALEREPTLTEIQEYGLDGGSNPRGYLFNTLQWRLDLIRAALTADRSHEGLDTEAPETLDAAWAAIEKALQIGASSYDGDHWYAENDGIVSSGEEGRAAMKAGFDALARLRGTPE